MKTRADCVAVARLYGFTEWQERHCCDSCHEDHEEYGEHLGVVDDPRHPGSEAHELECCCRLSEEIRQEAEYDERLAEIRKPPTPAEP